VWVIVPFCILVVVPVVVVFIVVISPSAIGGLIVKGPTKVVVVVEFPIRINILHGGDSSSPPKPTGIGGEGMDHQSSPSESDEPSESIEGFMGLTGQEEGGGYVNVGQFRVRIGIVVIVHWGRSVVSC
jgi:hypothetical protein